ncbi:MAG TPA: tetratricopeptide repeat protein [Rhizomicrobium sp.]
MGRAGDAVIAYRHAIALQPRFSNAWSNMGVAFADQNKLEEAVAVYRQAISLEPDSPQAYNNLALALLEQGFAEDAVAAFDRAVALQPGYAEASANRIFAELYRPGVELADLLRLSRKSDVPFAPTPQLSLQDGRPRLGFVSADFRQHAVGFLAIAALEALARRGYEIVCYSNSRQSDALTERFRASSTIWRDVFGVDDDQMVRQIQADGIGILFDLSGYSRGNRLSVFARKPAPVQIGWIGYPATTGLPAMDYFLTDKWQTPEGADAFYSETLIRMPHSYITFEPSSGMPEPGVLPALQNGYVTFASFNVFKKINRDVVNVWAGILNRLPTSQLMLKSPALDCAATRARAIAAFAAAGVAETRLKFLGSSSFRDHVALMARADIALDTFPYSGGMTTLESLWMGLPVVTWPQATFASRHSLGYLSTIGLTELVAANTEDYANLTLELARDLGRLSNLRNGMRARILASPLVDSDAFAAALSDRLTALFAKAR